MKHVIALMLLCLCSVLGVSAQTNQNAGANVSIVNGSLNPSAISDAIAYRLYFYVLTNEAQAANVAALHLNSSDSQEVISILNDFKSQDERIRSQHGSEALSGKSDVVKFQDERDELIQSTRNKLQQSLSSQGMSSLDSAVQLNKTNITLTVGKPQSLSTDVSTGAPPPVNPPPTCTHIQSLTWTPSTAETAVSRWRIATVQPQP